MSEQNPYQAPQKASELQGYQEIVTLSRRGRLGRLRYFVYLAVANFITGVGVFLGGSTKEEFDLFARQGIDIPVMIFLILMLVAAITCLVIGIILIYVTVAKRLQDFNIHGAFGIAWLVVGILLPPIGMILSLMMGILPGSKGENKFGLPPYPNSTEIKVTGALIIIVMVLSVIGFLGLVLSMIMGAQYEFNGFMR